MDLMTILLSQKKENKMGKRKPVEAIKQVSINELDGAEKTEAFGPREDLNDQTQDKPHDDKVDAVTQSQLADKLNTEEEEVLDSEVIDQGGLDRESSGLIKKSEVGESPSTAKKQVVTRRWWHPANLFGINLVVFSIKLIRQPHVPLTEELGKFSEFMSDVREHFPEFEPFQETVHRLDKLMS